MTHMPALSFPSIMSRRLHKFPRIPTKKMTQSSSRQGSFPSLSDSCPRGSPAFSRLGPTPVSMEIPSRPLVLSLCFYGNLLPRVHRVKLAGPILPQCARAARPRRTLPPRDCQLRKEPGSARVQVRTAVARRGEVALVAAGPPIVDPRPFIYQAHCPRFPPPVCVISLPVLMRL